ncbi:MAG TPA: DNA-deoxyinosine glycosylase [Novimethylophilus sp.]|jgi:TDG/mug DNA glycosylase family protein|uniref:DNA-deoxyinosine glycosylase n=1 Tax=Novimethylophilus sp. TaxID=2137426 RepID=UPI002F41F8F7
MIVRSFAPVARADAKVLILGSMPGKISLARRQYYAHPHNLFWRIMGELFGAGPELPYDARLLTLQENGVALWDVLKECYRESALDADIVEASIIANDFAGFFARHRQISRVYFNGAKAEQAFRRYALPGLSLGSVNLQGVELARLPSTSPANAAITADKKLAAWRSIRPVSS